MLLDGGHRHVVIVTDQQVYRLCIRCGMAMTANCDRVCVPCLLKQGKEYMQTGDVRVFLECQL